jgi:hypothetical protein
MFSSSLSRPSFLFFRGLFFETENATDWQREFSSPFAYAEPHRYHHIDRKTDSCRCTCRMALCLFHVVCLPNPTLVTLIKPAIAGDTLYDSRLVALSPFLKISDGGPTPNASASRPARLTGRFTLVRVSDKE